MTPEDKKDLTDTMMEVFNSTSKFHTDRIKESILAHENADDHAYIKIKRETECRRAEMWEKAKGNCLSYLLIGVVGGSILLAWQTLKTKIGQ
jgi:hypothetical protein